MRLAAGAQDAADMSGEIAKALKQMSASKFEGAGSPSVLRLVEVSGWENRRKCKCLQANSCTQSSRR